MSSAASGWPASVSVPGVCAGGCNGSGGASRDCTMTATSSSFWKLTAGSNTPYFSNSIRQNLLVIHYSELANEGMRQLFEKKRYSAYRNYVKTDSDHCQNVVCVTAIDTTEHIEEVHKHFLGQDWAAEYRVDIRPAETSGFSSMKFYDASCSREAMLRELETRMGTKKTVTFGGVPNKYDVFIENSDRNLLVKELKKRFEPVDWRCWKSVFRW